MLKNLIIQLCDSAPSFCHYLNHKWQMPRLIFAETLKKGLLWAMKRGLDVHIIYPDYEITPELKCEIEIMETGSMGSIINKNSQDVFICKSVDELDNVPMDVEGIVILNIRFSELHKNYDKIKKNLQYLGKLNLNINNIDELNEIDFKEYEFILNQIIPSVVDEYKKGHYIQMNVLTDRLMLSEMNNCNAGVNTITLAPNGKFYICPAYYYENPDNSVGDIDSDLEIPNQQLYRIQNAPICRTCDAFHCKRCVWLNQKMTLEVNTPSHEQCLLSHIERNASKILYEELKVNGIILDVSEIKEIDYLDPYDKF